MAASQSDVVGLYLAYFGRPPDPAGLNFYTSDPSTDIWAVAASFSTSAESQALYGAFGAGQIKAIYQNLFNRDPDPDGLAYWTDAVENGDITPAGAAYAIMVSATNADKIAVDNKIKLCMDFLTQLDTQAEIDGYSGDAATARARAFIHTVDSTTSSLALARAVLSTQVAYATGQITLTFGAVKDSNNVVSFSNAGGTITVTESAGVLTFTTSGGNSGTATINGTVAGFSVPTGTTLNISSALAGSKAFTGAGTALVIADPAGDDLSAMTATGVDLIQLTAGQNYTLTTAQMAMARIGAGGTLGNIVDAGKMTVIGSLDSVSGAGSTALKAAGADVIVGLATTGGDLTTQSIVGVDRIDLVAGQDYAVTEAEAKLIGLAPGTQQVTIANSASSGITLAGSVEKFVLSNFPGNKVTMGSAAQVVIGGTGADTLTAISGVTSTSDLKEGANVVIVTAGVDISKGTFKATGGTLTYNVDAATTATMKVAQVDAIGSAEGKQNITLGDAATGLTLRDDIETFTLGNFTNSVTMSDVAQVVIGGTGADTVTAISGVTSSNDLKAGANVVIVTDGADLSKGVFTATGGTISFNLNGIATAKLSAAQAANIGSATGTQTVTIANAAVGLDLASAVDKFVLGNFTNSVTLKAEGQSVTGGTGVDTVATGALAASGTLDGGGGTGDVLSVGGTLGAATVSNFEVLNVSGTADISAANGGTALGTTKLTMAASAALTMTIAQNEGLKESAAVSGASQTVTLSDAGSTKAIAGIETYVLGAGGTTIDASAFTTAALKVVATTGSNVIITGGAADTVVSGDGDDTITLGGGADVVVFKSLSGVDTLTDFATADKFNLSKAAFTGFATVGAMASGAFEAGVAATKEDTRILYDSSTGDLYYDVDGNGSEAAVHIATLTGKPDLSATNFVIIA